MGRAERRQIDQLFRDRYTQLCRAAFAIVRDADQAEDIVMEAFSSRLRTTTTVDNEVAYVYRSVINGCMNNRKRAQCEIRANERYYRALPLYVTGQGDPQMIDLNDPLWLSLDRLPDGQRSVVALRLLLDLSEHDTASILECSVGSVKSQLHKAKQTMAGALTCADEDDIPSSFRARQLEKLSG